MLPDRHRYWGCMHENYMLPITRKLRHAKLNIVLDNSYYTQVTNAIFFFLAFFNHILTHWQLPEVVHNSNIHMLTLTLTHIVCINGNNNFMPVAVTSLFLMHQINKTKNKIQGNELPKYWSVLWQPIKCKLTMATQNYLYLNTFKL